MNNGGCFYFAATKNVVFPKGHLFDFNWENVPLFFTFKIHNLCRSAWALQKIMRKNLGRKTVPAHTQAALFCAWPRTESAVMHAFATLMRPVTGHMQWRHAAHTSTAFSLLPSNYRWHVGSLQSSGMEKKKKSEHSSGYINFLFLIIFLQSSLFCLAFMICSNHQTQFPLLQIPNAVIDRPLFSSWNKTK